jgi:hypothetical protein
LLTKIEPYKGRVVDKKRRVEVYRNLTRPGGRWYSIRQDGLIVGHSQTVELHKCIFHVNEAGRQRVLRTGHKNVHAYVSGMLTLSKRARDKWRLYHPIKGRYNLRESANFERQDDDGNWRPMLVTMAANLSWSGLVVWMVRAD